MVAQGVPDRDAEWAELEAVVDTALGTARAGGADGAAVTASLQRGLSAQVRLGEVETLEHTRDRGLSVTVYRGRRKGHASSADLSPDAVQTCVERALDIARFTEEDRHNGLPEAEWLATEQPDLDLWHPRALDAEEAIARALACENAGRKDARISNSEGASMSASLGLGVHGNSLGFRGRSSGTRFSQGCVLIAGSGDGMQRDYWFDSRRAADDLEAVEATGRTAAERTVARLGARKIGTRKVPVLFAPEVARSLVGHLVGAVSGGALYRNASFLKDAAGTQLFPDWMNIAEQPRLPRGPGSAAFDAEGVATRERRLIADGVLTGYVLGCYSARRLGLQSTGNAGGVHNLVVEPGADGHDELLRRMGRGLLVTEVMGQGVNLVTGDYSRGASGFWIENGEIAHPVEEVTVAGKLRDVFRRVAAVGSDVDTRGNIQCGSLLVEELTVAGD